MNLTEEVIKILEKSDELTHETLYKVLKLLAKASPKLVSKKSEGQIISCGDICCSECKLSEKVDSEDNHNEDDICDYMCDILQQVKQLMIENKEW